MGLTDNLFNRNKAGSRGRRVPRPSTSQQHRLVHYNPGCRRDEHVPNAVTRYVVEGDGTISSSSGASLQNENSRPEYPKCICFRDYCVITCNNLRCNWTGVGRVRSLCVLHPSVTYLLDLVQCPSCSGDIKEIPDRKVPIVFNCDDDDL